MEKLLWSIALPGFGQFLNGKYVKGIVLLILEFLVNVQANFNEIIILSFHGDIEKAIVQADYQWLMFYPCLYFYTMWDAFKDAGGGKDRYCFLPFVFAAYFVTRSYLFIKTKAIWGSIRTRVASDVICHPRNNCGIFVNKDIKEKLN
jgi:TM2 domain-containing membrane protein YozV